VIEFRDVDMGVEPHLHEWYDVWAAAQAGRPQELVTPWAVARESMPRRHPDFEVTLFTAYDDRVPVGAGLLNVPVKDNPTVVFVEVATHPGHRRRGIGTAVLDEVERRVRALGRQRPVVEVYAPAGGRSPGQEFAEARGYAVANREAMKAVRLADSEPTWPALDQLVAPHLGAHRIVTWRDRCPDALVEGFGSALSRTMSLVPQGELDLDDSEFTVERLRAIEERRVAIGLATIESAAVTAGGVVVGLTGLRVHLADPRVAHVSVTMVLPGHRGHRLGLALKLASHRALRVEEPACELVATSNADVNAHMNAINDALGYRSLETLLECHRTL